MEDFVKTAVSLPDSEPIEYDIVHKVVEQYIKDRKGKRVQISHLNALAHNPVTRLFARIHVQYMHEAYNHAKAYYKSLMETESNN